jgi:mannose-1-phosphate guanylyltransferase
VLDLLPPEVDEAFFATGYLSEEIEQFVRENPPKVRVKCFHEATPLGTGGGLKNAAGAASDPFLMLNSDVISDLDTAGMLAFHRAKGGIGTMSLSEVEDTRPYGVAALESDDRISRFVEKPAPEAAPSHWINAGVQVWSRSVLDEIPTGRPVSFEVEVMPKILPKRIFGFRSRGFWEDAGTPARLLNAQRLLFDHGRADHLASGATKSSPTDSVSALPGSRTDGARLGPYVHVGREAKIGRGASVQNSILMDGAVVGADAVIRDSLLGPRSTVADGTWCVGQILS